MARQKNPQQQQQQQQQQNSNEQQGPQLVYYHSADVTKYKQVVDAVQAAEAALGPVDVLLCCAGMAELGYFHDCEPDMFARQMSLNYLGSLHAAKAVYDGMLGRNAGHIVFVASTMALMGLIGMSAYAPSKFAVRGLAECLRNELQGSKVCVSIAYPADINTPGYAKEALTKPWETAKVSEGVRLQSPEVVAAQLLRGLARGEFLLPNSSFLIGLLQSITAGLIPRRLASLAWEALLGLASPLICSLVAAEHDGVARQGAARRFARLWAAGQAAGQGAPPPAE
ncbi:hypothetical protein OEZ85_010179 [Tetradesmus obliquus]|uniref:3-dehydrosphinganine reductase n=1 Tax=Tetradesmus obliquus TaxID=3088 RepID=A0ABY8TLI6_TETOB|nr:hypothetical protein OEZ85_010179 [Tetradesmus obliquus]